MRAVHKPDNRERHLQYAGEHFKMTSCDAGVCRGGQHTPVRHTTSSDNVTFSCTGRLTSNDRYVRAGLSWPLQHTLKTRSKNFNCSVGLGLSASTGQSEGNMSLYAGYIVRTLCFPPKVSLCSLARGRRRDWLAAGIYWALMAQVLWNTSIKLCFYIWFIAQLFLLSQRCAHNHCKDTIIIKSFWNTKKKGKSVELSPKLNTGGKGQEESLRTFWTAV